MITDGDYLKRTIDALHLDDDAQKEETRKNAGNIVKSIMLAYGGSSDNISTVAPEKPVTGLVYGRIQSGKTRAMIASTAMAFDNGFRISVVLTSNINDLVSQTHLDFTTGLPGVMTFTKDNDLDKEIANAKVQLEMGNGRMLIVGSKGPLSLKNISKFLKAISAEIYPSIIFDDEGDQASLDTNTARRSRSTTTGVAVAPSKINAIIQSELRPALLRHVYVSVTGTPQAVLLQSADATHRPSFITMLPPGGDYIGGDHFFNTEEPETNPDHLIATVDQNEKIELLDETLPIPKGLRQSILFFLVTASAAIENEGMQDKGYAFLCHPSLKNEEQGIAEKRINEFLIELAKVLFGAPNQQILDELQAEYETLKSNLGNKTPSFDRIKEIIKQQLATKRLLVINAKVKRQGIAYGNGLNFLIGGNTLGRGIAVKNLLVTYYVRDSKISQIDTMHQHARMYGYRKKTLSYTKLFIPRHLYYKFRDIHDSDKDLRAFIEKYKSELPSSFPIEYTYDLRTTRPGVLDVKKTDTLRPKMHLFPNYVTVPQEVRSYQKVLEIIRKHFGFTNSEDENQMDTRTSKAGIIITKEQAIEIVKGIKTKSKNTWRDKTISAVITKVSDHYGGQVKLRYRTADRTVDSDGFFSTGAISGPELTESRAESMPTLWIMAVKTTAGSNAGAGKKFIYPSFIVPENFPKLFMFNRG
jgi:hypothetical protein